MRCISVVMVEPLRFRLQSKFCPHQSVSNVNGKLKQNKMQFFGKIVPFQTAMITKYNCKNT